MAALDLCLAVIKSELSLKPEPADSDLSLTAGFKRFAAFKEGALLPVAAVWPGSCLTRCPSQLRWA